jgi:hypothetical protein
MRRAKNASLSAKKNKTGHKRKIDKAVKKAKKAPPGFAREMLRTMKALTPK